MARNVYGLDLGTYEIKVYDKKQEKIWKQKNVIAIEDRNRIFAIGDDAYEMYEKTPDSIEVVFPMKNGVISRFENMQYLLQNLLNTEKQHFMRGSEYVIAVPTDVTEVEKRAFYDLVSHSSARAKKVTIVERGIADAVGLGINVAETKGTFIVNLGGSTTELSVLASGGMVLNRKINIGGIDLDNAVANLVRRNCDFMIGKLTSESLRREFGVFEDEHDATMIVAGRNLITGIPQHKEISIGLVRAAVREPLTECVRSIQSLMDRTPPDVRKSIEKAGIYITGGMANLRGLNKFLEETTGLKVKKAKHPDITSVEGIKRIIWNKELNHLTYSMLDEDYRWLG